MLTESFHSIVCRSIYSPNNINVNTLQMFIKAEKGGFDNLQRY